jgi:hypothetical protein
MKTKLCLLALLLLAGHGFAQNVIHGRVVAVTDGDSIRVLTANQYSFRVRVTWIAAELFGSLLGKPDRSF